MKIVNPVSKPHLNILSVSLGHSLIENCRLCLHRLHRTVEMVGVLLHTYYGLKPGSSILYFGNSPFLHGGSMESEPRRLVDTTSNSQSKYTCNEWIEYRVHLINHKFDVSLNLATDDVISP